MSKKNKKSVYSTTRFKFLLVVLFSAITVYGLTAYSVENQGKNVLGVRLLAERGSGSDGTSGSSGSNSSESSDDNNESEDNDDSDTSNATAQSSVDNNAGAEDNDNDDVEDEDENEDEAEDELEDNRSQFSLEGLQKLEVRTQENKTKIKIRTAGGRFELENENGKLKIKIKEDDGTETEIEDESLDLINDALEDEDIEIATSSAKGFKIRRGGFQAQTQFPISIDPTTNILKITTPAGEKEVAVLPDKAVELLLRDKLIDRISSQDTNIELELSGEDNPAFRINGEDDKKLLGLINITINKEFFISAQTGQVLQTNTNLINRLLDLLSSQ